MSKPVKANVTLRCAIHCAGAGDLAVDGFTCELARDHALVETSISPPGWLRPGRQVTLAIELPPFRQQAPRVLECGATVGRLRFSEGYSRVKFAIHSMAFTNCPVTAPD